MKLIFTNRFTARLCYSTSTHKLQEQPTKNSYIIKILLLNITRSQGSTSTITLDSCLIFPKSTFTNISNNISLYIVNIQDVSTLWILIKIGGRKVSDFEPEYNAVLFFEGITFVANATVVMSSFTVFLEMVCHVGSSQELAANFAGDFVLVACKVRAETISCGKRGITNLKDRNHWANASHSRKKKETH